jgi:hypothetical protein
MNFMKGDRMSLPSLVRGKRRYMAASTGIEVMMARQSSTLAKLPRRLQMGKPSYQIEVSNCWQCGCATNCKSKIMQKNIKPQLLMLPIGNKPNLYTEKLLKK